MRDWPDILPQKYHFSETSIIPFVCAVLHKPYYFILYYIHNTFLIGVLLVPECILLIMFVSATTNFCWSVSISCQIFCRFLITLSFSIFVFGLWYSPEWHIPMKCFLDYLIIIVFEAHVRHSAYNATRTLHEHPNL